jgi:hypothetical protein
MRKVTFIIFLTILSHSVFSQQFLWSTTKDSSFKFMRYISLDSVVDEVLEFYEQYQYYFDGSGYSKDGFFKTFENSQSFRKSSNSRWYKLKKKIYSINDLTVFAFKDNAGHGSVVLVVCVTKDNIDMLSFSNNYESDVIPTADHEKEKFTKWFRTIVPNKTHKAPTKKEVEESELQEQNEKRVLTKVEQEPEFPGGNAAWTRYFERSLGSFDAGKNGAAPGNYQVIVRFVVSRNGTVSDIRSETKHGFGMEEISVKIIQDGPKWKPALQNGRNVNAYRRQTINFIVADKN